MIALSIFFSKEGQNNLSSIQTLRKCLWPVLEEFHLESNSINEWKRINEIAGKRIKIITL